MANPPSILRMNSVPSSPMAFAASHAEKKLFQMKKEFLGNDTDSIQNNIMDHVEYTLARTKYNFDHMAAYQATAYSIRDRLIERWNETQQYYTEKDAKRVYYLSLEFLMGRSLQNAVYNLGVKDSFGKALHELGVQLEEIYDQERDAALGNGGLGRLAACFMDSLATLNLPAWGYGLRYNYGMFQQGIYDGFQTEVPDYWLSNGNPWEIERIDVQYPVRFYGNVIEVMESGKKKAIWEGGEIVQAVAYDTPVPGYNTVNTNNIRLWSSRPHREFDLSSFNQGNYFSAVELKQRAENITSVLYPNDDTSMGKELRLKQQYFFCAATLQDAIRRFKKKHKQWNVFPEKVAVQLNDTHPTIAIVELMRHLIDEECLDWNPAWEIVNRVFGYTNHTILPEALETWPVSLMTNLLPRHMQIIYEINFRFLEIVKKQWPDNQEMERKLSIIEEAGDKRVRMAHLAIVGSHCVNGVAALHSELVKNKVFPEFYTLWPTKFQNKTNGVTPRRWIQQSNPTLSSILTQYLKTDSWVTNLDLLSGLRKFADDPQLQHDWVTSKMGNKMRLAAWIHENLGVEVRATALFDIHIKRIHEYKRQLLNILYVIHRYLWIKSLSPTDRKQQVVPRVVIFAGKAAPGYAMAKRHIKLINSVADVVNRDSDVGSLLKIVFIPNYNVSLAEIIVPASDINQQISTAGTEASGTSNMKFAMNGSLIIGTLDGATVEIAQEVGEENLFIFGLKTEEIEETRGKVRNGEIKLDHRLYKVFSAIESGMFGNPEHLTPIVNSLRDNDRYLLIPDFPMYADAQKRIDETWNNKKQWTRMSILNTAGTGTFSSDRSIAQYAKDIWSLEPCKVESNGDERRY
eukprot:TRINITY_DN1058_c0_g1_i1.p1 TRINITY_DN1058_c0_g1~~TRINITY_DN1058_c0_g1_i1.p1  ORF type:complete len:883 (-),score=343.61 TRINITY_DN1058_c0_g1_i1:101-2668(-)